MIKTLDGYEYDGLGICDSHYTELNMNVVALIMNIL